MKKNLAIIIAILMLFIFMTACANYDDVVDLLPNLTLLYERDDDLLNTYSVLAVNPDAPFINRVNQEPLPQGSVAINSEGAEAFINWLLKDSTLEIIENFMVDQYEESLFYILDDVEYSNKNIENANNANRTIRISTTTSVNDSGLLAYLEPIFESLYGYDIEIHSAGTGAAINSARYGNADLIIVHSKSQEEAFISSGFSMVLDGFSYERISFMYNYFVLIGPTADPAGAAQASSIKQAFSSIAQGSHKFISRGDNSGTHNAELKLWDSELAISADGALYSWYISAGQGMGACLTMANEQQAYILSDKATYLTFKSSVKTTT